MLFEEEREREKSEAETYTKSTTHWPPFDREKILSRGRINRKWSAGSRNGNILHELFDHDSKCHRNGDAFSENNNQTRPKADTVNANLITANFPRESSDGCRMFADSRFRRWKNLQFIDFTEIGNVAGRACNSKIFLQCQKHTEFDNKPLSLITVA